MSKKSSTFASDFKKWSLTSAHTKAAAAHKAAAAAPAWGLVGFLFPVSICPAWGWLVVVPVSCLLY